MKSRVLTLSLILVALLLMAVPVWAAPAVDAGEFPTLTPTITATFEPTWTPTQPEAVVVTIEAYPAPTDAIEAFDPGQPSNIQEEATRRAQQEATAEGSGSNPLITAAYIGLFILLVVGVWMLFSRRGMGP